MPKKVCPKGQILLNGKCVPRLLPKFIEAIGGTEDVFVESLEEEWTIQELKQIKEELNREFDGEIKYLIDEGNE